METAHIREYAGRLIFFLIVCTAPLAFGAVDLSWQLVLTLLFAVAIIIRPPAWPAFPKWISVLVLIFFVLVVVKEFSPAGWFGQTRWRSIVEDGLGYQLGWTSNPSPATAFFHLLVIVLATLWVIWVRDLASTRQGARFVIGCITISALLVTTVGLIMQQLELETIYGIREVRGWQGFGPFPNRNHTANLIAVAAVASAGLTAAFWRKHQFGPAVVWTLSCLVLCAGVLASKSRGGLLAMVCGFMLLIILLVLVSRRRIIALSIGVAMALLAGSLLFFYGGPLLERFSDSNQGGDITGGGRFSIWPEVVRYWQDSPWFGHGLGSFQGTFPFYQQYPLDNKLIIHPESSWLQWLSDLGAVPLALVLALTALGIAWFVRQLNKYHLSELMLRGGAAAAVAAFSLHCLWDVPGHRWGTAIIAFSLLGVALVGPRSVEPEKYYVKRMPPMFKLAPLIICALIALPLLPPAATWSPLGLEKFINSLGRRETLNSATVDRFLRAYPLDMRLHELAGVTKLSSEEQRDAAWVHFGIMRRLMPMAWSVPAQQALLTAPVDQQMALIFWGEAVKRSRHRGYTILRMALKSLPDNEETTRYWRSYAKHNPEHLLSLAEMEPPEAGARLYRQWLARRSADDDLYRFEITSFYNLVHQYGNAADLLSFIDKHIELAASDESKWISLFDKMGNYKLAWQFIEAAIPATLDLSNTSVAADSLPQKQNSYFMNPADFEAAKEYILALETAGKNSQTLRELRKIIARDRQVLWFRWKLAIMLAQQNDYKEAVSVAPLGN